MLIVITRDGDIMTWAKSDESGARAWGSLKQLSAGTKREADEQMGRLLSLVRIDEPLCITGHGNNTEVGDEGNEPAHWTWTFQDLAVLLGDRLVPGFGGPILMEVCGESVTDFAAHLAAQLGEQQRLLGVWIYGYNKSVDVRHRFSPPDTLDKNVELTGKQVTH